MFKNLNKSKDTAHRSVIFSDIKKDGGIVKKFFKPTIWYVLSGLVIVLFTPILINSIVLYKIEGSLFDVDVPFLTSTVAEKGPWIGFFASYSGSIIGGILSGALTLVGVSLTIKQGRIEKMIESYPEKRRAIKELESILDKLDEEFNRVFSEEWVNLDRKIPKIFNQIIANKDKLIENASEINGISYLAVLDLVDYSEEGLTEFSARSNRYTDQQLRENFNAVKFFLVWLL